MIVLSSFFIWLFVCTTFSFVSPQNRQLKARNEILQALSGKRALSRSRARVFTRNNKSINNKKAVQPENYAPNIQSKYETTGQCCSADIIFVIDTSYIRDYSRDDYEHSLRKFMYGVLQRAAPKSCDIVRAAVIEYGAKARIRFDLARFTSVPLLKLIVSSYDLGSPLGKRSLPGAGFTGAEMLLNKLSRGRRPDNPAFVIWVTHTMPYRIRKLQAFVQKKIKKQAYLVVVGVGQRINNAKVRNIASSRYHQLYAKRLEDLANLPYKFQYNYCSVKDVVRNLLISTTTPEPPTVEYFSVRLTSITTSGSPTASTPENGTYTTIKITTTSVKSTAKPTTVMATTTAATSRAATTPAATTTTTTTTTPTTTTSTPTTTLTTTLLLTTASTQQRPTQPSQFCHQCRGRRNHKDLYADSSDCHKYFQCFYFNETYAVGISRMCPVGTFWHDPVLQCMPEGKVPCVDLCLSDDAVHAKGCYAGIGCRQFFVCAGTASYGFCCPHGTRFNESLCSCEEDGTCLDNCERPSPSVATTTEPAITLNSTVCQDPFGSFIAISIVPGESNVYYLLDEFGQATEKRYCPVSVSFDITDCSCSLYTGVTVPSTISHRKALLWLPLNDDTDDNSVNKFRTYLYDGAYRDTSAYAHGGGSLAVGGGYLSIPGLKGYDFRNSVSWCAFFRCESGPGFSCTSNGGILSNNKDPVTSEFSIIMAALSTNNVAVRLQFWHPASAIIASGSLGGSPPNGWNHICVSHCGSANALRMYLNGALVYDDVVTGEMAIAHCPYVVGTDEFYGSFQGHIDDILVAPFCMTEQEREAHRFGNYTYLQSQGFF